MSKIDEWPYPEVCNKYKNGDYSWREISEEIYYDQLECLPPIRWKGNAFMMGEPWHHDENGAIHTAFIIVSKRYFCRHDHKRDFNPFVYTKEIRSQFNL